MAERRLVVEHKDGRRVSVNEADFDQAEENPFNKPYTHHMMDANSGETTEVKAVAGKPMDDWQSLKAEGFKAVMAIDPETGNEVPL